MILCKFYVIFLTFILASSLLIQPLAAQIVPSTDLPKMGAEEKKSTFMNDAHRKEIYDQRKLSLGAAIGYSFLLPGLGNIYAEQYFVGALLMSAMVFATVFATYAFSTDQPEFYIGAGLLAGGSYVVAPITASIAVDDFNKNLRRGLKVSASVSGKDMLGISLKVSF